MTKGLRRFTTSSAYIDSGMIGAFILGVAVFALWIALETGQLVSPYWLGISIVSIVIYQLAIFWLILQYWEADRILGIFTSNVLCIGLIIALVEFISGVNLPNRLPVLSVIAHNFGYSMESFSPGAVAFSYAVIALFAGLIALGFMVAIERLSIYRYIVKLFHLDKVDLALDYYLDKLSIWLDEHAYGWLIVPQVLLVTLLTIVVGLAAVLM